MSAAAGAPTPSPVEVALRERFGEGRFATAGGGPLRGIAVHRGEDHWHLVTLGLSALAPRRTDGTSAGTTFGHELSLLLPASADPPAWAFGLLDGTARTAEAVGRPYHAGARTAPGAPLDGGSSALVALGVRADPLVPEAGGVLVLQLVGVTRGEHRLMQRVGTALVLERLATRDPLLRLDPGRA